MKKILLTTTLIFISAAFSSVFAQQVAPPGAGDTSLQDNSVKMRSVELDRIKKEANKEATVRREDGVELNFGIIKNDFEGIQKAQDKIVAGYQASKGIDYKQINKSAAEMTEMAIRLKANLFRTNADAAKADKEEEKVKPEIAGKPEMEKKSIRDLIINLDNAIGSFVSNTMFANLKTVDLELNEKAQTDLDEIIKLSNALWLESKKSEANKF